MGEGKVYQVVIARPTKIRYQERILPYLYENFSFERATEIDERILDFAATLSRKPGRGRKEDNLRGLEEEFRFILFKETRQFELKVIYYVNELKSTVYVTDFSLPKCTLRRSKTIIRKRRS